MLQAASAPFPKQQDHTAQDVYLGSFFPLSIVIVNTCIVLLTPTDNRWYKGLQQTETNDAIYMPSPPERAEKERLPGT